MKIDLPPFDASLLLLAAVLLCGGFGAWWAVVYRGKISVTRKECDERHEKLAQELALATLETSKETATITLEAAQRVSAMEGKLDTMLTMMQELLKKRDAT